MAAVTQRMDLIRSIDALKLNPLTRKPVGEGQYIYAYCNVRTKQVIYSLTQILHPTRSLKQIPNAGNNTKPPKLRKDLWRPLWTLTLPHGFEGQAQGMEAWNRLNALRYMHELYWTPPKRLSRNYTEKQIEKLEERIEDRGGSKKENVYDLIKRQKKKMRLKSFMNQKANSIADLAAVLEEQEQVSVLGVNYYNDEESREIIRLSQQAENGRLEKMEEQLAELDEQIKRLVKETPVDKEAADTRLVRELREKRYRTRRSLRAMQQAKEKTEHALLMATREERPMPSEDEIREMVHRVTVRNGSTINQAIVAFREDKTLLGKLRHFAATTADFRQFQQNPVIGSGEDESEVLAKYTSLLQKMQQELLELSGIPKQANNNHTDIIKRLRAITPLKNQSLEGLPVLDFKAKPLKMAREILLGEAEESPVETPAFEGEVQQISRLRKLNEMVKDSLTKRQSLESSLKPGQDLSKGNKLWRAIYSAQIKVWEQMMVAFLLTRGTLAAEDPQTGDVKNLGAISIPSTEEAHHTDIWLEKRAEELNRMDPELESMLSQFEEQPDLSEKQEKAPERLILKPSFNMDGIKVTWQNILDAEYAQAWPESVQHEPMGFTRHAARKPDAEPHLSAEEYYKGKYRPKAKAEEVEVRKDVVRSVTQSILERLNRPSGGFVPEGVVRRVEEAELRAEN